MSVTLEPLGMLCFSQTPVLNFTMDMTYRQKYFSCCERLMILKQAHINSLFPDPCSSRCVKKIQLDLHLLLIPDRPGNKKHVDFI